MAQEQHMVAEEIPEGAFKWKIDNFKENYSFYESPFFEIQRCLGCLQIFKRFSSDGLIRKYCKDDFIVCLIVLDEITLRDKTILKLCLIDRSGKEFFLVERISLKCSLSNLLTNISYTELSSDKNELLPNDTLTLSLSWYEHKACVDVDTQTMTHFASEKNIGVSDWSVPTEKPKSPPLKDKCTSTENIIGVVDRSVQREEPKSPPLKDKCTRTEKDDTTLLKILSEDLERFYEKKMETDCLLKVGNTEFPVHRQMLSARSEVFEAMFCHDTLESRSGTIEIPDIEAETLSNVLFYVYTGKIRCLDADSAVSMYVVADKYALMEMKDKCVDFLLYSLTLGNFCDAAVLAHRHGITELENKVILFIEEKLEEILDNDNWKLFIKNKPILANRLLSSAFRATKKTLEKMSS